MEKVEIPPHNCIIEGGSAEVSTFSIGKALPGTIFGIQWTLNKCYFLGSPFSIRQLPYVS